MKIKCLLCGDIIESKSVHDLVSCKCESCYIDGGEEYLHLGGKLFFYKKGGRARKENTSIQKEIESIERKNK